MRIEQTDGAIAAEMLTCAIRKMIHFLKTNRAGGLTLSAPIDQCAYSCALGLRWRRRRQRRACHAQVVRPLCSALTCRKMLLKLVEYDNGIYIFNCCLQINVVADESVFCLFVVFFFFWSCRAQNVQFLACRVREAGGFSSQEKVEKKNPEKKKNTHVFLTAHWSKFPLCCHNTAHT